MIIADKVVVRGPDVDGGYSITFKVGEHMQLEVAKLLAIPQNTTIELEIKPHA